MKESNVVIIRRMVYFVFFLVMLYISYQLPYCHDEWKWGLDGRMQLMKEGFKDYNGRYIGNILALIITRNNWAKAFIMASGTTVALYVISAGLNHTRPCGSKRQLVLLLAAAILLLSVPKAVFAQSYGWSAAYVNFVPPVNLFLVYYNLVEPLFGPGDVSYSRFQNISVIPLAFAGQLFSEHNTIFAVFFAVFTLLFAWVTCHMGYLFGSTAGALAMFSNSAYTNAASDADRYKKITFSIKRMITQYTEAVSDPLFIDNWLLNLILAITIIMLLVKHGRWNSLHTGVTAILGGYAFYGVWHKIYPSWTFLNSETGNRLIQAGMSLVFFVCVIIGMWLCMEEEKYTAVILYVCAAAIALPLLVADPIGARCFYASYLLTGAALLRCLCRLIRETEETAADCQLILSAVTALLLCFIFVRMFRSIGVVNQQRMQIIEAAIENGEDKIFLPRLPYSDYIWMTEPPDEEWEKWFKKFYHIPKETALQFAQLD